MNTNGILYLTQHDNNILTRLTREEESSKTSAANKRALGQVLSGLVIGCKCKNQRLHRLVTHLRRAQINRCIHLSYSMEQSP